MPSKNTSIQQLSAASEKLQFNTDSNNIVNFLNAVNTKTEMPANILMNQHFYFRRVIESVSKE